MQIAGNTVAALGAIWVSGSLFPPVWRVVCAAIAPILLTALWQSVILAVPLKIFLQVVPGISAAQRFRVWAAGFAAMVCLPFATLLAPMRSGDVSGPVLGQPAAHIWLQLDVRWGGAILLLWGTASIFRMVDLAIHTHRLRKLWKTATPVRLVENLPIPSKRIFTALGKRPVELCTTTKLENPSVIGFFSPRILVPEWLFADMTSEELDQIVCHEVQHLRRRDDWTNLLQKLCLILFPLNLALLWTERQMCREREMACDEAVVKATRAPRAYAACLTSLAERGNEHRAEALSLAAWQKRSELAHRVHRILLRKSGISATAASALLVLVSGGLALGSWELLRCPQLVAFVSASELQAVAKSVPERSGAILASNISSAGAGASHTASTGIDGFRIVPARAIVHPRSAAASVALSSEKHHATDADTAATGSYQAVEAVFTNAELPVLEARPEIARGVQQQWIVLTAWEQVNATPRDATDASAGGYAGKEEQTESSGTVQSVPSSRNRTTITRLIVRILPANLTFDQPSDAHVSNGWLVFQL